MKKGIIHCSTIFLILGCSSNNKIVFVVAGQSNAIGVGYDKKSLFKNLDVFEYNSKLDSLMVLKDPVGQNHMGFQQAKSGGFTLSFAYNYSELTEKEVYIVRCAKGGSVLH